MSEADASDLGHVRGMMRLRLVRRVSGESGFTLIEILVVIIIIGILAAIVLAVFLNQQDKANDSKAKSNVDNVSRLIQVCNAEDERDDYTQCDSAAKLGDTGLALENTPANEIASGDCPAPTAGDTVVDPAEVRILSAGKKCFVVLGVSAGGNRFWFIKHDTGVVTRGCENAGVTGCPVSGVWG